jgi:hypothetical protein
MGMLLRIANNWRTSQRFLRGIGNGSSEALWSRAALAKIMKLGLNQKILLAQSVGYPKK